MNIDVEIYITKIIVKARMVEGRRDNIIGFGELWFYEDQAKIPLFKLKGFAYKRKRFPNSNKDVITVDFPSIPWRASRQGYLFTVFIENRELYDRVVKLFMSALNFEDSNIVDIDNYTDGNPTNKEAKNEGDEELPY